MSEDLDAIAARAYSGLDDLWIEERVEQWIAPKIAQWCGSGRVLDMGWGSGAMGRALLSAGVNLTVLEGSPTLCEQALECGAFAVETMFDDFSVGAVKYDVCLCLFVLEHVEDPVALLRRVRGWLKPGGRLICVTPNAESIHRQVGSIMSGEPPETLSERDKLVGHLRVFLPMDLLAAVKESGFKGEWVTGGVSTVWGWFLKPVNNGRMIDWPAELIDALCEVGWMGDAFDAANIGVVARAV